MADQFEIIEFMVALNFFVNLCRTLLSLALLKQKFVDLKLDRLKRTHSRKLERIDWVVVVASKERQLEFRHLKYL